jgi:hypothetical protein
LSRRSASVKPAGDQDEIAGEFAQIRHDMVKEALGRSTDTGDTFIMRMYFDLLKVRWDRRQRLMTD